jgi:hypothetical protein
MKRLITISVLIFLAAAGNILKAQNCDFAQTGIRYNSSYTDPSTGNCIINIDLYFDLRTNEGSKYVTMHIWPAALYPGLNYSSPPVASQLANTVTVVINHFQSDFYIAAEYKPDLSITPQSAGLTLAIGPSLYEGYDRFTISNLELTVAGGCAIPEQFILDAWSTESSSMNAVHCFDKGNAFYANNPRIVGLLYCGEPRAYNVQIFSIDPEPMTVSYKVLIDNGDNVFNKVEDTLLVKSETGISIADGNSYNSGIVPYLPYSGMAPYANMNLWVEVTGPSLPNAVIYSIENTCSALPVQLKSFIAKKEGSSVLLSWITASEFNNMGFYIERKIGVGAWETIGFVCSFAAGGNSDVKLSYSYADPISMEAVLQYRLKQTDRDGKFEYSTVRTVKNGGLDLITLFPNPSAGTVNIVFPDFKSIYLVTLYNAAGKKMKSWQGCNSILAVGGLKPGVYVLKIENSRDGEITSRKIIVN